MSTASDDRLLPEQRARIRIDAMLEKAGWVVQDYKGVNLYAGTGVAVRELVTIAGPADYVLFVNRQAVGVIEAKRKGSTLSGVEWQTVKYQSNVPDELPAYLLGGRVPYGYESTGTETWFTCRMDPEPTARRVFWFHRPETLEWQIEDQVNHGGGTLRARIPAMPPLLHDPGRLREAQFEAITNLERSVKNNRARALIQMATGSGKTFAAANICERLIRHAQTNRILFLVDRGNLAKQTLKEFQGFEVPGSGRKFTELYNVQRLSHNTVDPVASVCIGTIQRMYSMLRGETDLPEDLPRACLLPPFIGPAIVKADCIRVRLHPGLDSRYVNYALQLPALRRATTEQIHGVGRPRLGMAGIKQLPVPLAPRAEQDRMVAAIEEHLSRLDAAEAAARSAGHRIKALEKAIITQASSTLKPPPHWRVVSVADAGRVGLGLQRSPRRHSGPNMRPYLRVANVFEDRIDDSDVMSMNMSDSEWGRYRLCDGDVLLNEGQSPEFLGRPAIYRGTPPEVAFTNSLIRFQANADVSPEWALLVFRSHLHNRRFMRESQITTNIAHLAAGRFKTVEFPVPPLDEQAARVLEARALLAICDRLRSEVAAARTRAAALRRSILAAAFAGRLVPQDPDDESASVLLERIRDQRAAVTPTRRTRTRVGSR